MPVGLQIGKPFKTQFDSMHQAPEKNGFLCWESILRAEYVYLRIIGYYLKNRKKKRNDFDSLNKESIYKNW